MSVPQASSLCGLPCNQLHAALRLLCGAMYLWLLTPACHQAQHMLEAITAGREMRLALLAGQAYHTPSGHSGPAGRANSRARTVVAAVRAAMRQCGSVEVLQFTTLH